MNYIYKIIRPNEDKATDMSELPQEEQDKVKEQLSQRLADKISLILARN